MQSGISTDLTSSVDPAGSIGTSKTAVKLVEPLSGRGHTLQRDHFYKSPDLCLLVQKNGINVAGTLCLNRRNVPLVTRDAKFKHG
jgi:hypothetical protein